MPQPRSPKNRSPRPRPANAPDRAEGTTVPVSSRFAVRLPLDEREPIPPPGGQDSPAWQLFYAFLGFLSGIIGEIPEMADVGILAFEVEAAYPGAPPGVIPEFEEGPLIAQLRERLPAILRQGSAELQTVVDLIQGKRVKVAAKFLRENEKYDIYEHVLNFVNHGGDTSSPSQAIEVTEGPPETDPQHQASASVRQAIAEAVRSLASRLPDDYEQRSEVLAAAFHAARQELAAQLAPALNDKTRAMPHDTYEEKKALAKWVNDELRRFDLAIRCPKTGEASLLLAIPGNHPEVGRFAIEHKTQEGKRVRSVTASQLPPLDLMEATPRREALLEWRDRVGDQGRGASRA